MKDAQREDGMQWSLSPGDQQYWDNVGRAWTNNSQEQVWRNHSDAVNTGYFARWIKPLSAGRMLKTDLFDEAVGEGLWNFLNSRAEMVVGMDVSLITLHGACAARPRSAMICADVRRLPFSENSFDTVISNSTLDHFSQLDHMASSLKELSRIVRPGGCLVITIDNLRNPAIAFRNVLPFHWLQRLGVLPYYVGATCGPKRFRRMVEAAGLEILDSTAILHCPRVIGVHVGRWLHTYGSPALQAKFGKWLMKWECLAEWPTRYVTGNYIAIHCRKSDKGTR